MTKDSSPRIHFPCPQCGAHLKIDSHSAGAEKHCPTCHASVVVPKDVHRRRTQQPQRVDRKEKGISISQRTVMLLIGSVLSPPVALVVLYWTELVQGLDALLVCDLFGTLLLLLELLVLWPATGLEHRRRCRDLRWLVCNAGTPV